MRKRNLPDTYAIRNLLNGHPFWAVITPAIEELDELRASYRRERHENSRIQDTLVKQRKHADNRSAIILAELELARRVVSAAMAFEEHGDRYEAGKLSEALDSYREGMKARATE